LRSTLSSALAASAEQAIISAPEKGQGWLAT
jgi:hypothetical protein